MESTKIRIADILQLDNSFITLFARLGKNSNRYGIVYMPPGSTRPMQLFSSEFAFHYKNLASDFQAGFTAGAIVGLARERTPADKWRSDTLERSMQDKNSIYRGILRIIVEEDGIPVFMNSTSIIGNIAPALAYFHRGNPVKIQQSLDRYNDIQKSIVAQITAGRPLAPELRSESRKTINRVRSINKAFDTLRLPVA
ncbi:MAG: hypothetical protein LBD10_12545 [Desulfobulbus sp.]|jgi:hypothetical protein|uniref:hypothetical protein n=1 Tax=Desulfobulbus sp. TaxID=895 RepID=UPI002848F77E|nr:hypothetical protein [Desulfobulbus sp.]MDR2551017.1 hypothetical protein [Desulfobulbus sp.]